MQAIIGIILPIILEWLWRKIGKIWGDANIRADAEKAIHEKNSANKQALIDAKTEAEKQAAYDQIRRDF